ncbi:MAG TPA: CRTAC1 family protein [Acidobacteriota bacterium]|nr:CRTAC1 family protein [Acidobacteriota bacterium]
MKCLEGGVSSRPSDSHFRASIKNRFSRKNRIPGPETILFSLPFLLFIVSACGSRPPKGAGAAPAQEQASSVAGESSDLFADITALSGIDFIHFNDASRHRYLPETMGSGAAFFDYDGDGRPDLYIVNGAPLAGDRSLARSGILYRNLDGVHFQDVTRAAGLDQPFYGMGVAVGDFDNDGHIDLFVSGIGADHLYRNRGDGTFEDVTTRMGLSDVGFGSSAAFLDYDRDGYLDLFIGRYVQWSLDTDIPCTIDRVRRIYCTPEVYKGQSNRLYRNLGGKRFADVTRSCGIYRPEGKTLGVVVFDQNRDGWPDLAIANDTVRNFLFINNHDGTFSETGLVAGIAYSESGATRGGMGIDAGDLDGSGFDDVVIGNFAGEMTALYRRNAKGYFIDEAAQAGIGVPTLMTLAFGTLLIDLDNDGRLDVAIVNGHIEPDVAGFHPGQTYAQPMQLFHNEGNGHFTPFNRAKGGVLDRPLVGRGLAAADIDGDGDLDLIVTQNGGKAVLLRNDSPAQSWIRIQLVGKTSNRTGYGAVVRAVAGGQTWTRMLASGRSYLSACEPVLTIGLGKVSRLDRLEIIWPSGTRQVVVNPQLNRFLTIEESTSN